LSSKNNDILQKKNVILIPKLVTEWRQKGGRQLADPTVAVRATVTRGVLHP